MVNEYLLIVQVVVSNISYRHPKQLGKWAVLTTIVMQALFFWDGIEGMCVDSRRKAITHTMHASYIYIYYISLKFPKSNVLVGK